MAQLDPHAAIEFFPGVSRDAKALIAEVRGYLEAHATNDASGLNYRESLIYSAEILRMVTRLLQLMAWILTQRAVHDGEIDANETRQPKWRLSRVPMAKFDSLDPDRMPNGFADLVERSENLFLRVERLDRQVANAP